MFPNFIVHLSIICTCYWKKAAILFKLNVTWYIVNDQPCLTSRVNLGLTSETKNTPMLAKVIFSPSPNSELINPFYYGFDVDRFPLQVQFQRHLLQKSPQRPYLFNHLPIQILQNDKHLKETKTLHHRKVLYLQLLKVSEQIKYLSNKLYFKK